MSDNTLIIELYPVIKGILITLGTLGIAATCTSCACAGLSCSVGFESTHKALNDRLVIMKSTSVVGGESWAK